MKTKTSRLAKTQAIANLTGGLIIAVGLVPIIAGIVRSEGMERFWMVLGGSIVALIGVLTIVLVALQLKMESNSFRLYGQLRDMHELSLKQSALLARIAENSALSDAARSLSNREMEIDRLRETIRTVIRTESWDAGIRLVDEMESRFGFTDEAAVLRSEIEEARHTAMRTKFEQASQMIEHLFKTYDWERAEKEIERLHHALPDEPRVGKLRVALGERKAKRKQELLTVWKNACGRDDVDEAIGVLRELDVYLTREEARELEETARSVFKAKLLQLGTQFQFAVNEHRWRDALEIGVQITEEFPNSRMSKEVAEAMDGLRSRAGAKDVDVTFTKHTAET